MAKDKSLEKLITLTPDNNLIINLDYFLRQARQDAVKEMRANLNGGKLKCSCGKETKIKFLLKDLPDVNHVRQAMIEEIERTSGEIHQPVGGTSNIVWISKEKLLNKLKEGEK